MWIPGFGKYTPREGNRVGDTAPDFEAPDADGRVVRLRDLPPDKPVVLVFYPRAGTPTCTKQMCALRDGWSELAPVATLVGVSYDPPEALKRFREQQSLPLTLISDADKRIARAYGVAGTFAAARVTFVIGTDRRIKAVLTDIDAPGHADQIRRAL